MCSESVLSTGRQGYGYFVFVSLGGYRTGLGQFAVRAGALFLAVGLTRGRDNRLPVAVCVSLCVGVGILVAVSAVFTSVPGVSLFGTGGFDDGRRIIVSDGQYCAFFVRSAEGADPLFFTVGLARRPDNRFPVAVCVSLCVGVRILVSASAVFTSVLSVSLFGTGGFDDGRRIIVTESRDLDEGGIIASGTGIVRIPARTGTVGVIGFVMNEIVSERRNAANPVGVAICAFASFFALGFASRFDGDAPLSEIVTLCVDVFVYVVVSAVVTETFGIALFGAGGLNGGYRIIVAFCVDEFVCVVIAAVVAVIFGISLFGAGGLDGGYRIIVTDGENRFGLRFLAFGTGTAADTGLGASGLTGHAPVTE